MDVKIGDVFVRVFIDSGFVCNLLGEIEFDKFCARGLKVIRGLCERELFAYGGRKLNVVDLFRTNVRVGKL